MEKPFSKLDQVRNLINTIDDIELATAAQVTLGGLAEIENLKERIELLTTQLMEGKQAAFYFFSAGLEKEDLSLAANTAVGRLRVLKEKHEKANPKAESDEPIEQVIDPSSLPDTSFGG